MNTPILLTVILVTLSSVVGLIVYEVLSKNYASATPIRPSAAPTPQTRQIHNKFLGRFSKVIEKLMPITRANADDYRNQLIQAGIRMDPATWRGLTILSILICGCMACALVPFFVATPSLITFGILFFIGGIIGWGLPKWRLLKKEKKRRKALDEQLPDAMQYLSVTIAAGSPVEQAFRTVAQNIEAPLSEEFARVDAMVHIGGKSRDEALFALQERCQSVDMTSFCTSLRQAANQGASISENLTMQADLSRREAQATLMERIKKMSTKLSIVLSFCSMPAIMVVILLPLITNLLEFVNDTM